MSTENKNSEQRGCLGKWWNQKYTHQKRLEKFLEHPVFHVFIIILVIVECAAVVIEIVLHNLKNQYLCNAPGYAYHQYPYNRIHRLEHIMHICHYLSISILTVFIVELLLKLYAYGYHYWNCKENHKLDYFDAFLAIFSYTVEIYFLFADKDSILGHSAGLIVILRLWHLLRIANAVARCFQTGNEFKAYRRERRNSSKISEALLIPTSIQAVLDLMQEKTECLRQDISVEQSLVERFEEIDQKLQDVFEDYYGDESKLVEEIEKLHLVTKHINPKKKYILAV